MYIHFSTSKRNLIFTFCPIPKGRSANQFAPFMFRGKQIDFYFDRDLSVIVTDIRNNNIR